jgi:hypothetical protein
MAKNLIEFQKGRRLPDCLVQYGTEAQCAEALLGWRWPAGLRVPGVRT